MSAQQPGVFQSLHKLIGKAALLFDGLRLLSRHLRDLAGALKQGVRCHICRVIVADRFLHFFVQALAPLPCVVSRGSPLTLE